MAVRKKKTKGSLSEVPHINRELSWLAFNERVLEEAQNSHHPLLERLNFLSISASNLDEFYMVRVAGLYEGREDESNTRDELLKTIHAQAKALVAAQQACWENLQNELAREGIQLITPKNYTEEDDTWLADYFSNHIFPVLAPVIVDDDHPFPHVPNLGEALILSVNQTGKPRRNSLQAVIPIPATLERFIPLPAEASENNNIKRFALLRDVLARFQGNLFPGYKVKGAGRIRIVRDTELDVTDGAEDLVQTFESALEKRSERAIVLLKISEDMPKNLRSFVKDELGLNQQQVVSDVNFLGLHGISSLFSIERPDLKFPPLHIRFPERIDDFGGDCFAAIRAKDIVVHHPYESFDVVVQFIRQAAHDPYVTDIKQTLYRTSSDSPIVQALIEAAEAGKRVTVVVELKARFDEAANLKWGQGLEQAGAQVIYGVEGLKTHAKMSLVSRNNNNNKEIYVHYGTGNYHPVTAKIYSDLSYFTCYDTLCRDAEKVFSYMVEQKDLQPLEKLSIAPFSLRKDLLKLIHEEIEHANAGRPGGMWLKMNALVDKELIDALYLASQAGVSIDLVVRGICCLKPGVEGLSENIRVKSIVGRFLEHTRIFCFGGGYPLPSTKNKVFIASADWMPRNMQKRIEIMVPINNSTVHEQILSQIMVANMKDEKQSWIMRPDGTYRRREFEPSSFSSHNFFIANPSLSGRGSALYGKQVEQEASSSATSKGKIAVMDIGSNSVRLVVYDRLKRVPLPLFNEKVLCGLARDMEKTGQLNKDGLALAYKALDRFMHIIEAMEVNDVYCIATAAVRDSEDGVLFAGNIQRRFGIEVKVLKGSEEAKLAALGVAAGIYEAEGVVGDLGGGSLELASVKIKTNEEHENIVDIMDSYPIGPLRLQSISQGKRKEAIKVVDQYLGDFPLLKTLKGKEFYAVGGGFRALAKIHIAREDYPLNILHQYSVSAMELDETARSVMMASPAKINRIPGMTHNRADTLAYTALIVHRIISLGKPKRITFSAHGVREGLLFDLLSDKEKREDPLLSGCSEMIALLSPDSSRQWVEYGRELCYWMEILFPKETHYLKRIRCAACILGRIAWYEHTGYRAEMAFRWVLDAELPGIDHWERVFIATAVFHRYRTNTEPAIMEEAQSLLEDKWLKRARIIGLAMRLGYELSGGASDVLTRTELNIQGKKLILSASEDDRALLGDNVRERLTKLADAMKLKGTVL